MEPSNRVKNSVAWYNLQKDFGWKFTHGFSDYLNDECELQDAIFSDAHMPFDVLTSKGSHAKKVDALTKEKLNSTLRLLEQAYDLVLIDSPPILAVADSLQLARAVDDVVFVVRWDETPKNSVKKALTLLNDARARPSGIVLNMIDPKEYLTEFTGGYSYEEV